MASEVIQHPGILQRLRFCLGEGEGGGGGREGCASVFRILEARAKGVRVFFINVYIFVVYALVSSDLSFAYIIYVMFFLSRALLVASMTPSSCLKRNGT